MNYIKCIKDTSGFSALIIVHTTKSQKNRFKSVFSPCSITGIWGGRESPNWEMWWFPRCPHYPKWMWDSVKWGAVMNSRKAVSGQKGYTECPNKEQWSTVKNSKSGAVVHTFISSQKVKLFQTHSDDSGNQFLLFLTHTLSCCLSTHRCALIISLFTYTGPPLPHSNLWCEGVTPL